MAIQDDGDFEDEDYDVDQTCHLPNYHKVNCIELEIVPNQTCYHILIDTFDLFGNTVVAVDVGVDVVVVAVVISTVVAAVVIVDVHSLVHRHQTCHYHSYHRDMFAVVDDTLTAVDVVGDDGIVDYAVASNHYLIRQNTDVAAVAVVGIVFVMDVLVDLFDTLAIDGVLMMNQVKIVANGMIQHQYQMMMVELVVVWHVVSCSKTLDMNQSFDTLVTLLGTSLSLFPLHQDMPSSHPNSYYSILMQVFSSPQQMIMLDNFS